MNEHRAKMIHRTLADIDMIYDYIARSTFATKISKW